MRERQAPTDAANGKPLAGFSHKTAAKILTECFFSLTRALHTLTNLHPNHNLYSL